MNNNGSHDPFRIILKGCLTQCGIQVNVEEDRIFDHDRDCRYECPCIEPDESIIALFESFKPFIRCLRQKYKGEGVCVDYADKNFRRAYMLAYYPYYISPVCQTLTVCNYHELIGPKADLYTCCFGGGPLPELIGIAKYVNSFLKEMWMIDCTVFDLNKEWQEERELYTLHLAGHYYDGLINLHDKIIDLWSEELPSPEEVANSDLVLFQNCFNDCPPQKYDVLKKNIATIWEKMLVNSTMIIIDLAYGSVVNLMREIEAMINNLRGEIVKPVTFNDTPLEICTLLNGRLFDGSDGLIPKYHCNYWSLVMGKR